MQPPSIRDFGRSGLPMTPFAFGTAPVGNIFREIDDATSDAMFQTAWNAGVRFYDTAPMYGHGLSELRTSQSLRWKSRDDFVLSSKVGRRLVPAKRSSIDFAPWTNAAPFIMEFDYSYDGTMQSFEDSLQRLALERLDVVFIHDIDVFTLGKDQPEVFAQAMDGCYRALVKLRDEEAIKAIGVGVNEWQVCHEALKRGDFDALLLAGRYTLPEQDALDAFLPLCVERGAAVLVGGGFNSGILATGAKSGAKYNYSEAPPAIMDKVARMEKVNAEFDVALPASALQFVVAHPAVPSFCAGTRTVEQLNQNLAWFAAPIQAEFWAALKSQGLLRKDAPVPQCADAPCRLASLASPP